MSDEIRDYDEELAALVEELSNGLLGLQEKAGKKSSARDIAAKSEKIHELSSRMQRAKQVLQSFKVELRDRPREQAIGFDTKGREYQQRLQTMFTELQAAKEDNERQQVGVRSVDEMTTQEVMQEATKVQDQSMLKVKRMQQQVEESRAVGIATAQKLKGQTDQLKSIDADIMKVKSNLARADVLLRAFMRKMATDKLIMGFMCLIFIGVIVIIVFQVMNPEAAEEAGIAVPSEIVDAVNPTGRQLQAVRAAIRRLVESGRRARVEAIPQSSLTV